MDMQFIDWVYNAAFALFGFVLKTVWDAVQDLKKDVKEIEINLPKDYVGKNDYKEDVREIKDMLKQLFEHLNNKADRHGRD